MVHDPWMKEVFQNPPNLWDKLIRARIPDPPRIRPKRLIPGMKLCGLNCPTCPYIEPGTVIQFKDQQNPNHTEGEKVSIYFLL